MEYGGGQNESIKLDSIFVKYENVMGLFFLERPKNMIQKNEMIYTTS